MVGKEAYEKLMRFVSDNNCYWAEKYYVDIVDGFLDPIPFDDLSIYLDGISSAVEDSYWVMRNLDAYIDCDDAHKMTFGELVDAFSYATEVLCDSEYYVTELKLGIFAVIGIAIVNERSATVF